MKDSNSGKRIILLFALFASYIHPITETVESISILDGLFVYFHRLLIPEECYYQNQEWWLTEMKVGNEIIDYLELISWSDIYRCFEWDSSKMIIICQDIMYPILRLDYFCEIFPVVVSIRIKLILHILIERLPEIREWLESASCCSAYCNHFFVFNFDLSDLSEDIEWDLDSFTMDLIVADILSLYSLECTESHMECEEFFRIRYLVHQLTRKMQRCCRCRYGAVRSSKTGLVVSFFCLTILDIWREWEWAICCEKIRNTSSLDPEYSSTLRDTDNLNLVLTNSENSPNLKFVSWSYHCLVLVLSNCREIKYFTIYESSSGSIRSCIWGIWKYDSRPHNSWVVEKYHPIISEMHIDIPKYIFVFYLASFTIDNHHPCIMTRMDSFLSNKISRKWVTIVW